MTCGAGRLDSLTRAKSKTGNAVQESLVSELENSFDRAGLIASHAYSLIEAYEVTCPRTNRLLRLIKLRNPWGNGEWKGDWSDNSECLTYLIYVN